MCMTNLTPQQEALTAIFMFLREEGFTPKWGRPYMITVKSLESRTSDNKWDTFQIYFLEDELCINRSRIEADGKQKGLRFGFGAQFLELADPECFDQIVDILRGKKMTIEEW